MSAAALFPSAMFGLGASALLALLVWALSVRLHDVSIVDIAWGFLVLTPAAVVATLQPGPRAPVVMALEAAWAVRLSGHIFWRHRGQPEDRRYRAIRARNEPHFAWKSLYLVFDLQVLLGWVVAAPVAAAATSTTPWQMLDAIGIAIVIAGLLFEAIADAQLERFKTDPAQRGQVMQRGLWRYSRHPNYFGECCLWWGFGLIAVAAGAPWSLVSPLLMTVLLLKVSGVALLEKDIGARRPGYDAYVRRTSAFIPWKPRS